MKLDFIKKTFIEPSTWNPRKNLDEEKFKELKESIKTIGIIEPIIIRKNPVKPKYFLLTAGYQRWKTYKDNELIPCIITIESELNAKIRSISENIFRSKLSDPDREKTIHEIYQHGLKENKWKNYTEMSKETKIPIQTISTLIKAHEDRKQLGFRDHEKQPSTSDLKESRPLKDKPKIRKKLLQKRLDSEIKGSGHIVYKISKELKDKTPQKASEILEDETKKNIEETEETQIIKKINKLSQKIKELSKTVAELKHPTLKEIAHSNLKLDFISELEELRDNCNALLHHFGYQEKDLQLLEKYRKMQDEKGARSRWHTL